MAAVLIEQPYAPFGVAKSDKVLSQELDVLRIAIRVRQLGSLQCRQPIATHCCSHPRARPHAAHQLIVFASEHAAGAVRRLAHARRIECGGAQPRRLARPAVMRYE